MPLRLAATATLVGCLYSPAALELSQAKSAKQWQPSAVTVLSGSNSERAWSLEVRENHEMFAELQGYRYDYVQALDWSNATAKKEPQWLKVQALLDRLRKGDSEYVLWIDDDIVFTSKTDFVKSMIDDMQGKSLLLSKDIRLDQVNTGIMLFRQGPESIDILERMWRTSDTRLGYCREQSCFHEQEALERLLDAGEVQARVVDPVDERYNLNTMWRMSHYDEARKNRYGGRLYLDYDEKDPPGQRWQWGMNTAHVSGMTPVCRAPMLKWIAEYAKRFVFGFRAENESDLETSPHSVRCQGQMRHKSVDLEDEYRRQPWMSLDWGHLVESSIGMHGVGVEVNYEKRLRDRRRPDNFTVRLSGQIMLEDDGEYEFFTMTSNGSKLTIDGKCVANENEVHSSRIHSGKAALAAGLHNISLEFSEPAESKSRTRMMFSFRKPGSESRSIVLPSFTLHANDVMNSSNLADNRFTCLAEIAPKESIFLEDAAMVQLEVYPFGLSVGMSSLLFLVVFGLKSSHPA